MNAELSLSRANRTLLDQESTVLVFVDVQQRLLQHIHGRETVLENCIRLARFAHVLELPVLVCEQQKLGPTAEPLRLALEQGGFYAPIPKVRFSCMDVEDFAAALKKTGRSTLLLAGIEAHICILQTALHALDTHRVHVAADAVGSRAPHNRDLALERMRHAGVVVGSAETAMYEIMRGADAPCFRHVLPLVK